jgi:hypothetical protein
VHTCILCNYYIVYRKYYACSARDECYNATGS